MTSIGQMLQNTSWNDKVTFLLKLILIFALLYDINFVLFPSITTTRLAFLSLVLLNIKNRNPFPRAPFYFLGIVFFIFVVSLVQFIFSSDSSQSSRLFWFSLYGIITPFLLEKHLKNRNEFLFLISLAVSLQAILSIFSFINPSVKGLFYNLIIFTSNYDETETIRATGFASIGGAGLSVIQSTGIIATLILMKLNSFSFVKSALLWGLIFVIAGSTFIIGRTGLFISIFAIGVYILSCKFKSKNILLACLIGFVFYQINFVGMIEKLTSNVDGFNVDVFTNWIDNAFRIKDNTTADNLGGMPIPDLELRTILGTGRVVHESGEGNASMNDSGYIQTYYSLGILAAFLFYSSYFLFLFEQIKMRNSKSLYILLFITALIEIKEPFIFQYAFPFFVLSVILLINKTEIKSNKGKLRTVSIK